MAVWRHTLYQDIFFSGSEEHKSFAAPNSMLCKEILIETCAASISEDEADKSVTLGSFNFFFHLDLNILRILFAIFALLN